MNKLFTQIQKAEPVAFGGFSELYIIDGKAVKLLEDACYLDVLEESYRQNLAAEAGLAPKIYTVTRMNDQVVVVMDIIDSDVWYHADAGGDVAPTLIGELCEVEMQRGLRLFCELLNANLIHADFHTGNFFMNDDGETLAIDFGIASELHEAPTKHLKRAVQFMLPALEQLGFTDQAVDLFDAYHTGDDDTLREALAETALAVLA
jgi:RIO-like serine/threonine protein kinase